MTDTVHILSPAEAVEELLAGISRPARLLVAVSGGSDSAGLLFALAKAASFLSDISLFAATVDHDLRPESASEAEAVAAICRGLGIPHRVLKWEGAKPATGLSTASREARYSLLSEAADAIGATAILTGHTLDDQAETVAMRAARGTAEDNLGLAGMAEAVLLDRRHWLLRPFLRTRRADIRTFLGGEGQGWIDDPSNLNRSYERVRVRERLAGEQAFELQTWAQAVERRTPLSEAAAGLLRAHATVRNGVLAILSLAALKEDAAVSRHAFSVLSAAIGGRQHGLKGESMERVAAFLGAGAPGRITAGRVIFDLRRDGIYMARENRGMMPLDLPPGGTAVWDGRYRVANTGSCEIRVGPAIADRDEAIALFPDVPPAIAMRAMAAMPCLGGAPPADSRILLTPVLSPYDRFLPQFDLSLAREIAVLLGCDAFPPLPVKVSARKS